MSRYPTASFRKITKLDPNPGRSWEWTPTLLGVVLEAGPASRAKVQGLLSRVVQLTENGDIVNAWIAGNTGKYRVRLNFGKGTMHCDCSSFEYRESPCKHIAALAAKLVASREDGDVSYWLRTAVIDDRNSGRQFKAWELRPEHSDEEAEIHGVEFWERYAAHVPVTGYMMPSGKVWTGGLPLPEPDDRILAYLPTGEQVPAQVVKSFTQDPVYLAFTVYLDWTPDGYDDQEVVLFGSEMLRR